MDDLDLLLFTEKKRIRKSFAKRASVLQVPFLLETQLVRTARSCRSGRADGSRKNEGLQAAFTSDLPDLEHSGNARLEFVCIRCSAAFRRRRMPATRLTYCRRCAPRCA
jgi:hypothetical protein